MGLTRSRFISTTLPHCTLWKSDRSPSCRSVMMALDAMDISLTEVDVDMDKAEHKVPNITKMNPLKTLPILKDKDLVLFDSHTISTYLASRYCIDRIYPDEPTVRAQIDQVMHYDSGVLQPIYRTAAYPILFENSRFVMPQQKSCIECAYHHLEAMLSNRTWLCGDNLTLGDITVAATVTTLNVMVPVDKLKYPLLTGWLQRMSEQPFHVTGNVKGLKDFAKRIDTGEIDDANKFKNCPQTSITRRATGGKLPEK